LFVVDNSLSMLEEQRALINSFPRFMSVVTEALGSDDFHVMVVDTDAGSLGDLLGSLLGGAPLDTGCGGQLGAGRRLRQDGAECGLPGDQRFIDATQSDPAAAFSCIAEVGLLGDPREAPVDAMLASLAPGSNAPGGCNAGFLREDAILVVTVIGDEDDQVSQGEPSVWHDALVASKGGNEEVIVFLGLVGDGEGGSGCGGEDAEPAPRLQSLAEAFTFGSTASVCADDYGFFFEDAVSVIDTSCAVFPPVLR